MMLRTQNGATFYKFFVLEKFVEIDHAVFTRHAGCSQGSFASLNVSFGVGDDDAHVIKNRQRVSECVNAQRLFFARQIHGDQVIIIDEAEGESDRDARDGVIGDAMVTNVKRIFLVVQAADCQAVMMYDPVQRVVANVHVGWRGSLKNIIGATVRAMHQQFGSCGADLIAAIGPSLGPCCAEFVNFRSEIPRHFWSYKDDSHHFDFWAISRDQLIEAGLLLENIALSRICTKCNMDVFFSYRGQGVTGRFAAAIGLK